MIEKFVEENLERDIKNHETLQELYSRYLLFCKHYEIEFLTIIKFSNLLRNNRIGVKHKKTINGKEVTGRQGIRLLPCKY